MIPAEDTYVQIIGDESQVWATARATYVPPTDPQFLAWQTDPPFPGQELILLESEADINDMMRSVGLGHLAPAGDPPPAQAKPGELPVTRAEFDALEARVAALE